MTFSHHEGSTAPDSIFWKQRSEDMSWRQIEGEVIVLDLRSATYLRLNPTGALLWHHLESAVPETTLIDLLTDRFDLTVDQAREDVATFLKSCAAQELIEPYQP